MKSARRDTYQVLVPLLRTEGAERILWYAAAVAHAHLPAEIVAVDVVEVPCQTPMGAAVSTPELMIDQQMTLELARIRARELGVDLRTRAIIGRSRDRVLRRVIRQEKANHLVIERPGPRQQEGSPTDVHGLFREPGLDATLVKIGRSEMRSILVLVSRSPHAVSAARRALELARTASATSLTLLNVQRPQGKQGASPRARGHRLIRDAATEAGISPGEFRPNVLIDERPREALLRAATGFDTVCVGASRRASLTRKLFGSLPGTLRRELSATVVVARGRFDYTRSFVDDLAAELWRKAIYC